MEDDILRKFASIASINSIDKSDMEEEEFIISLLSYFAQSISSSASFFAEKNESTHEYVIRENLGFKPAVSTFLLSYFQLQGYADSPKDFIILDQSNELKILSKSIADHNAFDSQKSQLLFIPYRATKDVRGIQIKTDILLCFLTEVKIKSHDPYFIRLFASYYSSYKAESIIKKQLHESVLMEGSMRRFFSDAIYQILINGNVDLHNFQSKVITPMFVDIRGFTHYAENTSLDIIYGYINSFLGWVASVINEYRGTLEKYLGDGLFAFWGAPIEEESSQAIAVFCAKEILFNFRDKKQHGEFPESWNIGIGLSYGAAITGMIGSDIQQYTALGKTVNLASRLCSNASDSVVISKELHDSIGDGTVGVFSKTSMDLKGITKDATAYTYS